MKRISIPLFFFLTLNEILKIWYTQRSRRKTRFPSGAQEIRKKRAQDIFFRLDIFKKRRRRLDVTFAFHPAVGRDEASDVSRKEKKKKLLLLLGSISIISLIFHASLSYIYLERNKNSLDFYWGTEGGSLFRRRASRFFKATLRFRSLFSMWLSFSPAANRVQTISNRFIIA